MSNVTIYHFDIPNSSYEERYSEADLGTDERGNTRVHLEWTTAIGEKCSIDYYDNDLFVTYRDYLELKKQLAALQQRGE